MENENNTQKKKKEGIPVFCERIKTLALESGECKTHQEFADRVNAAYGKTHLDRSYINKMIAGENDNPNAVTLASIAKAFDVSVDWLLGLTEETATTGGDIANAAATTGLSSECIQNLQKIKEIEKKNEDRFHLESGYNIFFLGLERLIKETAQPQNPSHHLFYDPSESPLGMIGELFIEYDKIGMLKRDEELLIGDTTDEGIKKFCETEKQIQKLTEQADLKRLYIFETLGRYARLLPDLKAIQATPKKHRSKENTSTKQTKEGRKKK